MGVMAWLNGYIAYTHAQVARLATLPRVARGSLGLGQPGCAAASPGGGPGQPRGRGVPPVIHHPTADIRLCACLRSLSAILPDIVV